MYIYVTICICLYIYTLIQHLKPKMQGFICASWTSPNKMLGGHGDCISPCLKHTSQAFLWWFLFLTFLILALKTIAKILKNQKTERKNQNRGTVSKSNRPGIKTKSKFEPETTTYDHHWSSLPLRVAIRFLQEWFLSTRPLLPLCCLLAIPNIPGNHGYIFMKISMQGIVEYD